MATKDLIKFWNSEKDNFIFKTAYKANFQKSFWGVGYFTRFMPLISLEIIIKESSRWQRQYIGYVFINIE